jgi:YVTN family beta-propeller protein
VSGLPTGTVTFLFSDIEGSTRLLRQLGARYGEVLATHQELLREAFLAHGGHEIDTQGDSFFVAFARARDAVAAAVDAQRSLAAHEWPRSADVRVRVGLHSGEPAVGEQRYVGLGVHRAARIGAAGHGGQVLLSGATRELVKDDLPPGVGLRDLGERSLKDLEGRERIFQLVVAGLESDFPRLRTAEPPWFRRRRIVLAGALAGAVAAAATVAVFATGRSNGLTVGPNTVAILNPRSNRVVGQVPVGTQPGQIAFGSGSVWVANVGDQTLSRIDPETESVGRTVSVGGTPTGLATTRDAVWVVSSNPTRPSVTVRRIETQYDTVSSTRRIGSVVPGAPGSIAADGEAVWVAPSAGLLARLDATTGSVAQTINPNAGPVDVALDAGALWVTDPQADTVTRVDPTGLATPIAVGHGPRAIATGSGAVWVVDTLDDAVVRIDRDTRAVTATIQVGAGPSGVAVGAGAVWVANSRDGTVTRIDPATASVTRTIRVGGSPSGVVVAGGRVWVTVQRRTVTSATPAPAGGSVHFAAQTDVDAPDFASGEPGDNLDPALAGFPPSTKLLYATCAKLLNYPDRAGPVGSTLVPEVAQALPAVSDGGRSYTFTIRRGFRFSPPSNAPVTAQTFKYTIERALSPKVKGYGATVLNDIAGARAFLAGKARHISGVTARGETLVIRLVAPAPDFLTRIALPNFCAVPIGTPLDPKGVAAIPMAGPYYIASYTPGQSVVLLRNPNYGGNRPHRLRRMTLTFGVSNEKTDAAIEAGRVDYGFFGVARADAARLAARYGPAARSGRRQYFRNPSASLDFLVLNTHRPLFRDSRVRRAVSYAIDRSALASIGNPFTQLPEPAADGYLPPGMPGYRPRHIYPLSPDIATARRLGGHRARTAVFYTCNFSPCDQLGQVVATDLKPLGIDVVVKGLPASVLYARFSKKGEPFDIGLVDWVTDYADPDNFLDRLLRSGEILPPFEDSAYGRKLDAAAKLSGPARYLAYGKLADELAKNEAPWVVWGNGTSDDFFSARMGCQIYQPEYGIDLASLCIKA